MHVCMHINFLGTGHFYLKRIYDCKQALKYAWFLWETSIIQG